MTRSKLQHVCRSVEPKLEVWWLFFTVYVPKISFLTLCKLTHVSSLTRCNFYEELSTLQLYIVIWFSHVSHTGVIACIVCGHFNFKKSTTSLSIALLLLFTAHIKFCWYSAQLSSHVVCDKKRHTNFLHQIAATRITRFRIKLFLLCAFNGLLYTVVYINCVMLATDVQHFECEKKNTN